jgi:hypothetical protein
MSGIQHSTQEIMTGQPLEVDLDDCTPIAVACRRLVFEARATGLGTFCRFNDTTIVARPGDTAEAVERAYWLARGGRSRRLPAVVHG